MTEYAAHLVASTTMPAGRSQGRAGLCGRCRLEAGPLALRDAGAEVIAIACRARRAQHQRRLRLDPPAVTAAAVVEHGADAGFALDGDADRCLAVDHEGNIVDGDQILAVLALALRDQGLLVKDTVVATVMSNLGFVRAMKAAGVGVRQTKVGDRYVLEAMKVSGYTLGGEQSGHVILSDYATTGDGILTALKVLERMAAKGQSLQELAGVMTRLPQVLVNVPDVDKARADEDAVLAAAVAEEEATLGETGRILLRPSGTEAWCASWSRRRRPRSPTTSPTGSPAWSRRSSHSDPRQRRAARTSIPARAASARSGATTSYAATASSSEAISASRT